MPGCEALLARPIQFLRVGRLGNVMRSDEILHKHGKKNIYIYIWAYRHNIYIHMQCIILDNLYIHIVFFNSLCSDVPVYCVVLCLYM